jgi:HSP20 family molecular chaperone IbpA
VPDRRGGPLVNELKAMKERMDALYMKSCVGLGKENQTSGSASSWQPEVDVLETEREWFFIADLPGVREEGLRLEVVDNTLRISGNKPADTEVLTGADEALTTITCERAHGSFNRVLTIPLDAQEDAIQAELKNGVLTVTIPKQHAPNVSEHRITVHSR